MSKIEFTFPRDVECFKWNGNGSLEPDGTFAKGAKVTITSALERVVPSGRKVITFEVWRFGHPYYFDPTTTGVSRYTIKFLTQELRTYRLKKVAS